MASCRFIITIAVVAIVLPAVAMATEHIVGGDAGWTVEYDYAVWAKDKVFRVGDTLVFKYTAPNHNVIKVNATEFKGCTPSKVNAPLTSGNDVITLSAPGWKWYICGKVGIQKHCDLGQKLAIKVVSAAPAPSPTPSDNNSATGIMSSVSPVIVAAVIFMATIMV